MFCHLLPSRHQHATVGLNDLNAVILPRVVTSCNHHPARAHLFGTDGHNKSYAEESPFEKLGLVAETSCPIAESLFRVGVQVVEVLNLFQFSCHHLVPLDRGRSLKFIHKNLNYTHSLSGFWGFGVLGF